MLNLNLGVQPLETTKMEKRVKNRKFGGFEEKNKPIEAHHWLKIALVIPLLLLILGIFGINLVSAYWGNGTETNYSFGSVFGVTGGAYSYWTGFNISINSTTNFVLVGAELGTGGGTPPLLKVCQGSYEAINGCSSNLIATASFNNYFYNFSSPLVLNASQYYHIVIGGASVNYPEITTGTMPQERMAFNITNSWNPQTALVTFTYGFGLIKLHGYRQGISSVTLISPINNSINPTDNIIFNCSANIIGSTLSNISLWHNATGIWHENQTISLIGTTNYTSFNLTSSSFGKSISWNCKACEVNATCGFAQNNNTIYPLYRINEITYNSTTTEFNSEDFFINLTYNSSNWINMIARLNYNGTNYLSTKTGISDDLIFNNTISVPTATTNYAFFWNISFINATGTYYSTTSALNQSVNPLSAINITSLSCGTGQSLAFNFTSFIESNLSAINFTKVDFILRYGSTGNTSAFVAFGNFTNIPTFNICINTTSIYSVGYGEIQYEVNGYSPRRFYIFKNTRFSNTTISNYLYSLDTASSTAFQITATDTALIPYSNYYIALLRWYPSQDSYKIVDMGKTDEQGQTVLYVKTNDVDYRIGLYEPDGTLVKLLEPIRMVCQTTPCVYYIVVDLEETDLTTIYNVESSLTWDSTTGVFTYIYNDPSQETTAMNLSVWQDFPDRNSIVICTKTSNDFTGVLVCDVSGYTGQLRAEVWREASPRILIAQLFASVRDTIIDIAGGKTISLLIGFILIITFALMGVASPILMIILGVISLIPLVFLGVLDKATFIIIGCIGGIVLHFLRRIT